MKDTVNAAKDGKMVIQTMPWEWSPVCASTASCHWYYSALLIQASLFSLIFL